MKNKPNIIVFMSDQQNAQTVYPSHAAKTPNIDKFLQQSTQFTNCYTCAPHCCPARATFFTGLYPTQHGVWNNVEVDNTLSRGLYDGVTCFPETLKEAGYTNIFAGKWHVSAYEGPLDRGFDTVLREYVSNYGRLKPCNRPTFNDWEKLYVKDGKRPMDTDETAKTRTFGQIVRPGYPRYHQFGVDENPFGDSDTVDLACKAIESYDSDAPLFMYVGTTGPHDPYCVPQEFLDLYDVDDMELPPSFHDTMADKPALYRRTKQCFNLTEAEHKESMRRYLAFISYEDALFGKVLDSVEKSGMADDTVVLYLTDHGDYLGAHGLWAKGLPCFDEAYHIPAIIRGPGFGQGVQYDAFTSIADFAPTILELAGLEKPASITVGHSLVPALQGDATPLRTECYTQTNGNEIYGIQRSVWDKKWKYVYNAFDFDELYDREADPHELHNLLPNGDYNSIVRAMCKKMWTFARDTGDNCTCDYIMVGLAPYGPGIVLEDE